MKKADESAALSFLNWLAVRRSATIPKPSKLSNSKTLGFDLRSPNSLKRNGSSGRIRTTPGDSDRRNNRTQNCQKYKENQR
jgi:hypothetical protein